MALAGWNDRLKVGHDLIDSEHIRLVDLLDCLEDAVTNHLGLETYGKVLDQLLGDIRAHFANEEKLMALHRYALAEQHTQEHQKLLQKFFELKVGFDANTVTLTHAQLKSLEEWLTRHIMESDKALAEGIPSG